MTTSSAREVKAAWRDLRDRIAGAPRDERLEVGIVATFTAEPWVPFLGMALAEGGALPALEVAPYGRLLQACADPGAALGGEKDILILLWRIEDLAARELDAFLDGAAGAAGVVDRVDELVEALRGLRSRTAATLMVGVPPSPRHARLDPGEPGAAAGWRALHRRIASRLVEGLAGTEGLLLLDLDGVEREVGAGAAHDPRLAYLYRQPFTDRFLAAASDQAARLLAAHRGPRRKCLVLDCDGTLWGGVVGEDGPGGIELGEGFPGAAYRDVQRLARHWRSQGVLLCLASKNNEAEAFEVFDTHDGMVLRREDLAAWRIDWEPKPANLVSLAEELAIGVDSLVFVDDSAFEIAAVREALPEVLCIQVPEDPAAMIDALRAARPFDTLAVTADDRARTTRIQEERARREARAGTSHEDFLAGLELRLELFHAAETHLGRVAQLIGKTNQFNLTTRRRTPEEVAALMRSPAHRVLALRVADRFGEYGLTGVAVLEAGRDRWELDTFLLSCRVLGRGVESGFLAGVAAVAAAGGARRLGARFLPTAKNAPAAGFLPAHGFEDEGGGAWSIAPEAVPPAPTAQTLVRDG